MTSKKSEAVRLKEIGGKISHEMEEQWDNFCDCVERLGGSPGEALSNYFLRRLTIEAPVVIAFCFTCVLVHILAVTIMPGLNTFLAILDTFHPFSMMQYPTLLTHIFAHADVPHLKGNMVNLLLVGPSAEHVYGSQAMLIIFALVGVASALAHIVFGSAYTHQLGASGVVFSTILLNSLVAAETGKIPLSFLLTAGMWIGDEVWRFFFSGDGISHHAHLTGAILGTAAGYYLQGQKALQALHERKRSSPWGYFAEFGAKTKNR